MPEPDHQLLTGPVDLRGRRAPSRVLFGPHETNLGDPSRGISSRHVAYYARRAAGGAGVIVTETASVHPSDHPYAYAPAAFVPTTEMRASASSRSPRDHGAHLGADMPVAAGWAGVAAACRPHGTLVLAGLGHAGGQGSTAYTRTPLWGPSRMPDVVSREVPVPMERTELDALVAGFAAAAATAAASGLDGVEVNAGQHSLLRQFCSGLTNVRDDAYGADRGLLLREVLAAVRSALGPDHVLGLRLCVDELAPWAGITPSDGVALAVSAAGSVDYLVPVRGSALSVASTRPDMHTPPGFGRDLCRRVRAALRPDGPASDPSARPGAPASDTSVRPRARPAGPLSPPAIVWQGSVVDPATASSGLRDGAADLVEMTRAQIADPDLLHLVRAGTPERVRPCSLSNQGAARDPRNPVVGDEAEPRSGHETTDPPVDGTDPAPREVLVVGGGPAGCEAARTFALRGHRVTLHERTSRLGGALRLAALLPGRSRWDLLADWWAAELVRLRVEVRLGSEICDDDLRTAEARGVTVVLATGSRPPAPLVSGAVTAAEFLAPDRPPGPAAGRGADPNGADPNGADPNGVDPNGADPRGAAPGGSGRARAVVVVDPVGDATGPGIAELLAADGGRVTLVTPDAVAGDQLGRTGGMADANARLDRAGVDRAVFSRVGSVSDGRATLVDVHTGATRTVPCDLVIDCSARLPEDALWGADRRRLRAGDCVAPRTAAEAVREGRRIALALGGTADRADGVSRAGPRSDDAATARIPSGSGRPDRAGETGSPSDGDRTARMSSGFRPGSTDGAGSRASVDGAARDSSGSPAGWAVRVGSGVSGDGAARDSSGSPAGWAVGVGSGVSGDGAARDSSGFRAGSTVEAGARPSADESARIPSDAGRPRPVGSEVGGAGVLHEPIRLGPVLLRNRIVFTAHLTGFARDGLPTPRHAAYYAARAAGGAAMVITEEHAVLPGDRPYENVIRGHDPAASPGRRAIADAVHAHGAVVLAQLNHNGGQSSGMYSREPVVAPSALPDPMFREVAVAMTDRDIGHVVDAYARTAAACAADGFDGVELQCSHASLLRMFLSPATNRRTDCWGGSPAGRARIVLDVVRAVRAAIGPDRVLGVRLGADERIPGGLGLQEGVEHARLLGATGAVDYLSTSIGVATASLHLIEASMHTPSGYASFIPSALRRAVSLPVLGVGRFTTPAQAEATLAAGECDLVGVARGQIADPEFAAKAVDGRPVRRCVGCNQECVGRVGLNAPLGCAVNPRAGHEWLPAPVPVRRGLRVAVVGGGPAGLAAAAALARRGHRVTVYEKDSRVGGQLVLAALAPGRCELAHVVDDLAAECARGGVRIRTGVAVRSLTDLGPRREAIESARTPGGGTGSAAADSAGTGSAAADSAGTGSADADSADADSAGAGSTGADSDRPETAHRSGRAGTPDAIVLATGSAPARPAWWRPGVVSVHDVLSGAAEPTGSVLVVDELGFHQATSTAELLAARGCAVEIVTPALVVGQDLGVTLDREGFRRRAHAAGITGATDRVVLDVTGEPGALDVTLLHHPTGAHEHRRVAAVVHALSTSPCDHLWTERGNEPVPVLRIGDCLAPRRMDAAIREGERVADDILTSTALQLVASAP